MILAAPVWVVARITASRSSGGYRMFSKTLSFLKHELREMLPATIFFFVVFHTVAIARNLMATQYGLSLASSASATVGALIVGKAILITDKLPLTRWFGREKLVYNVLWRVALYALLVLLFQLLEELIPLASSHGSISVAWAELFHEIEWHRFWAVHLILVLFLCFYCFATAVIDAFGRPQFVRAFFGPSRTSPSR